MAGPGDPCCMYMPQQVSPPSFLYIERERARGGERLYWEPRKHCAVTQLTYMHTAVTQLIHLHSQLKYTHQHAASSTVPAAERKDVQYAAHDDKPV